MAIKNDTRLEARIGECSLKETQSLIRMVKIEVSGQRNPFHQDTQFFLVDGNLVCEYISNPENANGDIRQRPPFAHSYQFPFYTGQNIGDVCLYTLEGHLVREDGISVFNFAEGKSEFIPFNKYNPEDFKAQ